MGAFQQGFSMGAGIASDSRRQRREDDRAKRDKEAHDLAMQEGNERLTGVRRTNRVNAELDDVNAGIRSYVNGDFAPGGAMDGSYDRVEAQRLGVAAPPAPTAGAYDPTSLEGQAGLGRRLMSAAALKGDYAGLQALQDKQRDIADTQVFNGAVQQFAMNPDSFTDFARWINKTHPSITTSPAKDPRTGQLTGYNIMTVGPTGDATHKFLSPQQAAELAGATALMRTNPTKALQIMARVDQGLAQTIGAQMQAQEKVATTNNTATHYGNTDATNRMNAESNRITAGANASRAKRENQTASQKMEEQVEALTQQYMKAHGIPEQEARKLALQAVTKDPDRKESPDANLEALGISRIGKDYYKPGKGGQPEKVQLPGQSKLDAALDAYTKGKGGAAGITKPQQDPGRPFYDTPTSELKRIATKPRGVSSAEASAAADELERRKGESRLGAF